MVTWLEDGDLMESSSRRMERSQSMDLKDMLPVNTQILVVDLGEGEEESRCSDSWALAAGWRWQVRSKGDE